MSDKFDLEIALQTLLSKAINEHFITYDDVISALEEAIHELVIEKGDDE